MGHEIELDQLIEDMMNGDLELMRKERHLKEQGFKTAVF